MHDMRVVEFVESVLVELLGVEPEEVLPFATVQGDLNASEADVATVLHRLRHALPHDALSRLSRGSRLGQGGSFTVEELVVLAEDASRQAPAGISRIPAQASYHPAALAPLVS